MIAAPASQKGAKETIQELIGRVGGDHESGFTVHRPGQPHVAQHHGRFADKLQGGTGMDQPNSQPVNLLWTGGWDSTFRLLQLLLLRGRTVQPCYVIDSNRLSTGTELLTMARLKQRLFAEHPETRKLLLPTRFKDLFDIQPNPDITAAFGRIHQRTFLGSQYEGLARFCADAGIHAEVGLERGAGPGPAILEAFATRRGAGEDAYYEVDEIHEGSDEHTLLRWFNFPVFGLFKRDMQAIARQEGFEEFLQMTWFCHSPRANSRPCGVCNPCIFTMKDGMGARFPFTSRLRYHLRVRARVRDWLRKHPALHARAKQLRSRGANLVG
jgi:hypothetical protein